MKRKKKGIKKSIQQIKPILKKPELENSIILNGVKIKVEKADLDKDGETGGTETVKQSFDKGVLPVKDSTELGDAIKEQNKDVVSERLSSMDFGSRIDKLEMSPMVALDSLIGLGVIPVDCGKLNRVKMQKSVGLNGLGRKEFVDLVTGKKEQDMKTNFGQKLSNFVGIGGQKQEQQQ